jgi:hypothetical protein
MALPGPEAHQPRSRGALQLHTEVAAADAASGPNWSRISRARLTGTAKPIPVPVLMAADAYRFAYALMRAPGVAGVDGSVGLTSIEGGRRSCGP